VRHDVLEVAPQLVGARPAGARGDVAQRAVVGEERERGVDVAFAERGLAEPDRQLLQLPHEVLDLQRHRPPPPLTPTRPPAAAGGLVAG
jgi:hypothetical protein